MKQRNVLCMIVFMVMMAYSVIAVKPVLSAVGYITPSAAYNNVKNGTGMIIDVRTVEEHNTKNAAWITNPGQTQSSPTNTGVPTWIDQDGKRRVAPLAPWWTAVIPAAVDGPDPDSLTGKIENSDDVANFNDSIEGLLGAGIIDFNTPLYLICEIGGRTYGAAWYMSTHVYNNPATGTTGTFLNTYSVDADSLYPGEDGGMIAWITAGLPTYVGDTPPNAFMDSIIDVATGTEVDVLIQEPRDGGYYTYPDVRSIALYADGWEVDLLSGADITPTPTTTVNHYFTLSMGETLANRVMTIAVKDGIGGTTRDPYAVNPAIKATAGANGTITPAGDVDVNEGNNQTFTITPDDGYIITDVVVDDVSAGAVSPYTFTNVTADHTIHATFEFLVLEPNISASPTSNDFGLAVVGAGSAAATFTVSNTGAAGLLISGASLAGTNPGDFAITGDTCSGETVAPAGSCVIDVVFSPTQIASLSASLLINSDDADTPELAIGLSGTGVETAVADISVNPTSKDFGAVVIGTSSAVAVFTVSNNGLAELVISGVSLAGTNPSEFAITGDTCSGAPVAPNGSCVIDVVFSPTEVLSMSGSLVINSNDPDTSVLDIGLSGTGEATEPDISATPASKDFGSVDVGAGSVVAVFTVSNNGTADLLISGVSLAGTNPSEFAITGDTCSGAVAPAANCTIDVVFSPTAAGDMTALLLINSNDPDTSELSAGLSGTGVDIIIIVDDDDDDSKGNKGKKKGKKK